MTADFIQAGGNAMSVGLEACLGMAAAQQMAQSPRAAASNQVAAPRPHPVEHIWPIADNGGTKGPFSKSDLSRMAINGELRRDTFVRIRPRWMTEERQTTVEGLRSSLSFYPRSSTIPGYCCEI